MYTALQEKKLLLKQAQPPNFKGEGLNVERDTKVWLEAMDDYFDAASTQPENQTMLAMFRLTGDAKNWWKQHCQGLGISGSSQSWEEIKSAVTERYLPPAHKAIKMNEFFSLRQMSLPLEDYFSKFVTLKRYAPKMTLEQQVARFCQGLIEPLNSRLEALRSTTLQDALLRAKTLASEIQKATQGRATNFPNCSATNVKSMDTIKANFLEDFKQTMRIRTLHLQMEEVNRISAKGEEEQMQDTDVDVERMPEPTPQ
ncbi:hypothetical protein L7F22_000427 [Adiantum nelumboides]|nr:hypothetical protein [Adiantum nelumboides]